MKIYSSVIFYCLSKYYPVCYCGDLPGAVELKHVRLYQGKIDSGYLYIIEHNNFYSAKKHSSNAAYIIVQSDMESQQEPCVEQDVAYISSPSGMLDVYEKTAEVFQVLQVWDVRLKEALIEEESLDTILMLGREMLDYSFCVHDKDFHNIAYSHDYHEKFTYFQTKPDMIAEEAVAEFLLDKEFIANQGRKGVFLFPEEAADDRFICKNIFAGGKKVARLQAILDKQAVTAGEKILFEHIGGYISKFLVYHFDDRTVRHRHDKLHMLLGRLLFERKHITAKELNTTFSLYNWEVGQHYLIAVLRFIDETKVEWRAQYVCKLLEEIYPDSCAIAKNAQMVWVVNEGKSINNNLPKDFAHTFVYIMRDFMCRTGISDAFFNPADTWIYYSQAVTALQIGSGIEPHYWYYIFDNYKLEYMLKQVSGEYTGKQLIHKGLLVLKKHDETNGTEYVRSLNMYLSSHFNAALAAEKMYVHRSTFIRRLERIKNIASLDLDNIDVILYLLISFKLLPDCQPIAPPPGQKPHDQL